ncbi:MAG: hypothetical protein EAY75_18320 [Bacteroidetes bacterium]|nr:MAG: hypothetical protein EAY75_18320 [Bacteroidota bacterium]
MRSNLLIPLPPMAKFGVNQSMKPATLPQAKNTFRTPKKQVIYIPNLMRPYPQQFLNAVAKNWPKSSFKNYWKGNTYYNSLLSDLKRMRPKPMLQPDSILWVSAMCHAKTSGAIGRTGHDRVTPECIKKRRFLAACRDYGSSKPLTIIMALLMDEEVESLGHRKILMSHSYTQAGVSI